MMLGPMVGPQYYIQWDSPGSYTLQWDSPEICAWIAMQQFSYKESVVSALVLEKKLDTPFLLEHVTLMDVPYYGLFTSQ